MRPRALLVLVPSLALASPVTYTLDPARTEIVALTHPAGLLGGMAHPHAIAARDPAGTIVYDPDAPERSRVEVRIAAASLGNDDPALRAKFGLEGQLSEEDRGKIAATMRSTSQLDVEHHPDITFVSQHVKRLEDGRLEVAGRLGIHGVEADVTLPVEVAVEGGVLRGQGTLRIGHHMFGIKPFSAGLGTVRNADGIELRLSLVAVAASPGSAAATP